MTSTNTTATVPATTPATAAAPAETELQKIEDAIKIGWADVVAFFEKAEGDLAGLLNAVATGAPVLLADVQAAAGRVHALHGRAEMEAHVGQAAPGIAGIKLGQRNGGHAHFVGIGAREEAQREDLEAMDGGHVFEVFIDGAHQNLAPDAENGTASHPLGG